MLQVQYTVIYIYFFIFFKVQSKLSNIYLLISEKVIFLYFSLLSIHFFCFLYLRPYSKICVPNA